MGRNTGDFHSGRGMVSRVGGAIKNAARFAAASATLGAINYDPASNNQINHVQDRKITAGQNAKAQQKSMNSSNRISYNSEPVRKNDSSVWE
jgi:hypothetical protein